MPEYEPYVAVRACPVKWQPTKQAERIREQRAAQAAFCPETPQRVLDKDGDDLAGVRITGPRMHWNKHSIINVFCQFGSIATLAFARPASPLDPSPYCHVYFERLESAQAAVKRFGAGQGDKWSARLLEDANESAGRMQWRRMLEQDRALMQCCESRRKKTGIVVCTLDVAGVESLMVKFWLHDLLKAEPKIDAIKFDACLEQEYLTCIRPRKHLLNCDTFGTDTMRLHSQQGSIRLILTPQDALGLPMLPIGFVLQYNRSTVTPSKAWMPSPVPIESPTRAGKPSWPSSDQASVPFGIPRPAGPSSGHDKSRHAKASRVNSSAQPQAQRVPSIRNETAFDTRDGTVIPAAPSAWTNAMQAAAPKQPRAAAPPSMSMHHSSLAQSRHRYPTPVDGDLRHYQTTTVGLSGKACSRDLPITASVTPAAAAVHTSSRNESASNYLIGQLVEMESAEERSMRATNGKLRQEVNTLKLERERQELMAELEWEKCKLQRVIRAQSCSNPDRPLRRKDADVDLSASDGAAGDSAVPKHEIKPELDALPNELRIQNADERPQKLKEHGEQQSPAAERFFAGKLYGDRVGIESNKRASAERPIYEQRPSKTRCRSPGKEDTKLGESKGTVDKRASRERERVCDKGEEEDRYIYRSERRDTRHHSKDRRGSGEADERRTSKRERSREDDRRDQRSRSLEQDAPRRRRRERVNQ
ncbi:hypothetical protein CBOM_01353 [Ceraceosorus bombacis]|uniref:RRM domain-containing protein n=1 Tax=Ceraceosorus bombacis TaxID=401625 RepID=A0A0P1BBL1_9BASI|nr:hypothetical protein CBOM_01353 [Ceraceosorus bombacis]